MERERTLERLYELDKFKLTCAGRGPQYSSFLAFEKLAVVHSWSTKSTTGRRSRTACAYSISGRASGDMFFRMASGRMNYV